jgi:uncharacterized protein YjiS (DUF1127 family)
MAHTSAVAPREQGFFAALGLNSEAVARFFRDYVHHRCRTDQIARLNKLSDAELAKIGIRRDQIVMHVFRDRL